MANPRYLATETVKLINDSIKADQGKLYRYYLRLVLPHIEDAYRQDEDAFRSHMGASGIGKECGRAIAYDFRWATAKNFEGQQIRLFNRGHLEEGRFIAMLLAAGINVYQQDENGHQFRISDAGGHFGGSTDGELLGIPDVPANLRILGEFKTLSTKYAPNLAKNGVEAEKFEHYVQMNIYMRKRNLPAALYLSVDKNTDELYGEIVPVNPALADQFIARAVEIIFLEGLPHRISENPGWFACRYCDHRPVCHAKKAPAVNCRTCMFSRPKDDGTWVCTNAVSPHAGIIDKKRQLLACDKYNRAF